MTAGTLGEFLDTQDPAPGDVPGSIADLALVRSHLIAAACRGQAVSYSELLALLGHRFTRPKMRAVCRTLDAIDVMGAAAGEPELAVLVVRESDRLPGQGWWICAAQTRNYAAGWTGRDARTFVDNVQQRAFTYWQRRSD